MSTQGITTPDTTVRKLHEQWETANAMTSCEDEACSRAAASEVSALHDQIMGLLPSCSPAVRQKFAQRGFYADDAPTDVGQRELTR